MTAPAVAAGRSTVLERSAVGAATLAAACLLALHLVQPGLDPAWSVVSQYALGSQGWIVAAMFLALGASCALVAVALPTAVLRRAGRIGRILLVVATIGLVIAAVFVVGTPLHEVGSLLGNAGLSIAAVLVGRDLRRGLDTPTRRWMTVAAHAPWVLILVMAAFIVLNVWGVGLINRAVVLAYIVWLVANALLVARLRSNGATA